MRQSGDRTREVCDFEKARVRVRARVRVGVTVRVISQGSGYQSGKVLIVKSHRVSFAEL